MKTLIPAVALALLPTLAFTQTRSASNTTPASIDFTQPLVGLDGKLIAGPDCKPGQSVGKDCAALTLGEAVGIAFMTPIEADRSANFDKKWADGQLAHQVLNDKTAVLSSEQISTIKARLGAVFMGSNVAFATGALLDPSLRATK